MGITATLVRRLNYTKDVQCSFTQSYETLPSDLESVYSLSVVLFDINTLSQSPSFHCNCVADGGGDAEGRRARLAEGAGIRRKHFPSF